MEIKLSNLFSALRECIALLYEGDNNESEKLELGCLFTDIR